MVHRSSGKFGYKLYSGQTCTDTTTEFTRRRNGFTPFTGVCDLAVPSLDSSLEKNEIAWYTLKVTTLANLTEEID